MAALSSVIWTTFNKLIGRSVPIRKNKFNLRLPPSCHIELNKHSIQDKAVFVIGDVHGCFDELSELIEKAKCIHGNILYILVGDLVNKGPKNKEVISLVRNLGAYVVRGNHDEVILKEWENYKTDKSYNLADKYAWIKGMSNADVEYLQQLPYTITVPDLNCIIVHAGIVPGTSLQQQKLNDFTNMRNIEEKTDFFHSTVLTASNKTSAGVPWVTMYSGPEHIYFGHDAVRGLQETPFATGLDTGCVYGGKLTGKFLNKSGTIIHVQAKHVYQKP